MTNGVLIFAVRIERRFFAKRNFIICKIPFVQGSVELPDVQECDTTDDDSRGLKLTNKILIINFKY